MISPPTLLDRDLGGPQRIHSAGGGGPQGRPELAAPWLDRAPALRPIAERLAAARELFAQHGVALGGDAAVAGALADYRAALTRREALGAALDHAGHCGACATVSAGGCCFAGMEEQYDELSLLADLLLGGAPPAARELREGCLFVGAAGCKLRAKSAFCLRFFCPSLKHAARPEAFAELQRAVEEEVARATAVAVLTRRWLTSRPPAASPVE